MILPSVDQAFAFLKAGRGAEGVLMMSQLAAQGDKAALFSLGYLRFTGDLVPQDLPAGREFFRRAGEAGHELGAAYYTNLLASGQAGPRDWREALKRLRREARRDVRRKAALHLIEKMKLTADGDPVRLPAPKRLSQSPDLLLYPGLWSSAESDYVVKAAEPSFKPSFVVDLQTGADVRDPIRTSDGSTFHWLIEDPVIHALNRRLAAASGTRFEQGEPLQILRYLPGQQYRAHLDHIPGKDNQRILTALVYLNDRFEGGETRFVRADLQVKGGKGDGIVFRNTLPEGRADPASEHAGLPVTRGVKYLASRWICERPLGRIQA
jgi:prolyl 4-hydroxylase